MLSYQRVVIRFQHQPSYPGIQPSTNKAHKWRRSAGRGPDKCVTIHWRPWAKKSNRSTRKSSLGDSPFDHVSLTSWRLFKQTYFQNKNSLSRFAVMFEVLQHHNFRPETIFGLGVSPRLVCLNIGLTPCFTDYPLVN